MLDALFVDLRFCRNQHLDAAEAPFTELVDDVNIELFFCQESRDGVERFCRNF